MITDQCGSTVSLYRVSVNLDNLLPNLPDNQVNNQPHNHQINHLDNQQNNLLPNLPDNQGNNQPHNHQVNLRHFGGGLLVLPNTTVLLVAWLVPRCRFLSLRSQMNGRPIREVCTCCALIVLRVGG